MNLTGKYHCDNGDWMASVPNYGQTQAAAQAALQACKDWMNETLNDAVTDAKALLNNGAVDPSQYPSTIPCAFTNTKGRAKCNVIQDLGLTLHASEDFYAHSNWADTPDPTKPISLTNPPGLNHTTAAPWISLRGNPAFPTGLTSECFDFNSVLAPQGKALTACPNRLMHYYINKDNPSKPRSQIGSNYQHAYNDAVLDTRDKWALFRERLVSTYGQAAANKMICVITHDNPQQSCGAGPNEACTSNAQCTNGACGRAAAGIDTLTCSPSGHVTTYAGYDYHTQMPSGTVCWSDAMCASGDCKGNMSGLRKGVCK